MQSGERCSKEYRIDESGMSLMGLAIRRIGSPLKCITGGANSASVSSPQLPRTDATAAKRRETFGNYQWTNFAITVHFKH